MASTLPDTVTADPANAAVARPRRGWLARLRRTDGEARPRPARVTVRKLGPVAALVRPIAMSLALLLAAYGLLSLGTTYWRGYERHLEHSQAVHADRSVFDVFFRSNLPPDAVDLVVRDMDGSLRRVVASRDATDGFVNDTILMLDEERDRIKRAAHADIDQAFDFAFADREQAVDAYADWFFEWKRSYVVLKDTLVSAATRFFTVGDYERLSEAVERDVKEYFMSHYMAQVLKPDLRDEPIVRALEQAARQAHDGFRRVAATNDVRLQLFLAQHTRHMADMPADRPMTRIALDWDAQRWKAPTYLMEDRAFAGIAGLGQAAAGGTVGALALGPVINRTVGTAFGALSKRFAASMGTRLAFARQGATAGGAVQPVSGHAVGAVAGVMVGFAADYFVNRADASFNRERFVTANHEALDATIETWKAGVKGNIDAAIDRWFDDMRASVVLANDQRFSEDTGSYSPCAAHAPPAMQTAGPDMHNIEAGAHRSSHTGAADADAPRPGLRARASAWRADRGHGAIAQRMAGTAFLIRVGSAALVYLSYIVLARWMGGAEFGIYVYVWTWVLVVGDVVHMGLAAAAQRLIPQYSQHAGLDRLRGFLIGSRWLVFAAASAVALLAAGAIHAGAPWLDTHEVVPLYLACATLPFYALSNMLDGIARSYNWANLALLPPYFLRPLLLLALMAAAHAAGFALDAVTAMTAAVLATWGAAMVQLALLNRRLAAMIETGPKRFEAREWFAVSLPILLVWGFYTLLTYTDILVLRQFAPPEEVAIYFAAVKTLSLVAFVHFAVGTAVAHRFSEYHIAGDWERLAGFVAQAIRWTFWPSLAAAALVLALGQPILWLFGPQFTAGYPLLFVLAVGLMARASVGPAERLLNMVGEQRLCALVYGIAFTLNLVLCLALAPVWGAAGAAASTAAALIVESALLFVFAKRRLGLHVSVWGAGRRARRGALES